MQSTAPPATQRKTCLGEVSRVPVGRRVEPLVVLLLPVVFAFLLRSDHLGGKGKGHIKTRTNKFGE